MRLNRRDLFMGASAAGALLIAPSMAFANNTKMIERIKPVITPELRMWNANTDERMSSVFFRDGQYDQNELRRIDWFMRDWRQAETKSVDPELLWALAAIREAAMGDGHNGEIRFLSGYRSTKTNNFLRSRGGGVARNSLHIRAKAIDFSFPGVSVKAVSKYASWLELGGVGYYPGSFTHIDTGQVRSWTG